MMSEQPLVERLHAFFVQVFTTYDLSDKDKRQEMKLLSFELDDEVAQLEEDKERLLEQLVAGEELYISRGIEIAQLEAENAALKMEVADLQIDMDILTAEESE